MIVGAISSMERGVLPGIEYRYCLSDLNLKN